MATTTQTRTRKTPQDRKPAQASVDAARQGRFEDVEGHELLIPFSKIKGSDQARMMARMLKLLGAESIEDVDQEVDVSNFDLDEVADFIDWVEDRYAVDPVKFAAFTAGRGGMERAMNLCMAYAGEMGEGDGSENG